MPSIISNSAAESALRVALERQGFALSNPRGNGETGVDILAAKDGKAIYIEVIGHKSSPPARAKDFFESFFRAISRIKDGAELCVIALPDLAERGLPSRAAHYGTAWKRLGDAFPEVEIWLVNVKKQTYERTSWNQWSTA